MQGDLMRQVVQDEKGWLAVVRLEWTQAQMEALCRGASHGHGACRDPWVRTITYLPIGELVLCFATVATAEWGIAWWHGRLRWVHPGIFERVTRIDTVAVQLREPYDVSAMDVGGLRCRTAATVQDTPCTV